jgi:hypothetical protein
VAVAHIPIDRLVHTIRRAKRTSVLTFQSQVKSVSALSGGHQEGRGKRIVFTQICSFGNDWNFYNAPSNGR